MTGRAADGREAPLELDELTLAEVREHRSRLTEEEERVSYWRRLVQFRLDLVEKEQRSVERVPVEDLLRSLGSTGTGARRRQLLTVAAQDELPDLPGLDELWTAAADPGDPERTAAFLAELRRVERRLSAYRRSLHERIDAVTDELVRRYQRDPSRSLELLQPPAR